MAIQVWANISSGHGLLSDTKLYPTENDGRDYVSTTHLQEYYSDFKQQDYGVLVL